MIARLVRWAARLAVMTAVMLGVLAGTPWLSGVRALTRGGTGLVAHGVLPFRLDRLAGVFPVGPIISLEEYYIDRRDDVALRAQRAAWRFGAKPDASLSARQIYVLVIGEASRRDHWQLNGYKRADNPHLAREPGLVSFGNAITPWPFTLASVPVIMTRKAASNNSQILTEPSIIGLFNEAGFRSYYLSNQAHAGAGSEIEQISQEADKQIWLNASANNVFGESSYDGVLLKPLARILAQPEHKQFIVLHLMGSHDSYTRRYPPAFDHFHGPPHRQSAGGAPLTAEVRHLRNTYDNTILYTDDVLSQVLDMLQKTGAVAGVFYISDHGESLLDGSCTQRGHGGTAEEQFETSAFAWLSNRYQQRFPQALGILRAHAEAPISTRNVFSSLADLAHITYTGEDPTRSVFNARFQLHRRRVNVGEHLVDWDHSIREGACRAPRAVR